MEEKLQEILFSKSFSELTEKEKSSFVDLFNSEEEYESLQSFFTQLEEYKKQQPVASHNKTKVSLDALYASQHQSVGFVSRLFPPNKPFYFSPVFQLAALLVIIALLYPLTQNDIEKPIQLAKNEDSSTKKTENKSREKTLKQKTVSQPCITQPNETSSTSTDKAPQKSNSSEGLVEDFEYASFPQLSKVAVGRIPENDITAQADYASSSDLASKDQEKSISNRNKLENESLLKEKVILTEDLSFSTVLDESNETKKAEKRNLVKIKSLGENTSVLAVLTAVY